MPVVVPVRGGKTVNYLGEGTDALKLARILVVDDNPSNVTLISQILQSDGYLNIASTTDPREAVDMFCDGQFDLLLLDIRMPHLDGFEVMAALRLRIRDDFLPILVLTAQTDEETCFRALSSGAQDFLTKPIRRIEVLHRIRNLLHARYLYKDQRRQRERLDELVKERTRELEETRLEVIRRLGRAGEFRDNETGMHVIRMSKASQLLALRAGLGEAASELILNASPMHDVGKIGIPDNILLKPGRLTPEERTLMEQHPRIGADIVGHHPSELMQMAREIALYHHEHWSGEGYPEKLAGADIPVAARITAICDVFDALTSVRPYKAAWETAEAVAYLKDRAGVQFDPQLIDHFCDILDDILILKGRYADPAGLTWGLSDDKAS